LRVQYGKAVGNPDVVGDLTESERMTIVEADGNQRNAAAKMISVERPNDERTSRALHGLTRTLLITGKKTDWESWVLLAEAEQITPQPNGRGYIIGDRAYYLDLPAQSPVRPFLRTRYGRQQLVAPITKATLDQPIVYTLVW
jgi:hypothetical protein